MKIKPTSILKPGKSGILAGFHTLAVALLAPHSMAAVVDLGSAADFAVLAGSGITIAGPVNSTVITGDIGSHPTPSITGTENLVLNGTNHGGDGVTAGAKIDLAAAFAAAALLPDDASFADGHVLGGTMTPGVYSSAGSFFITTTLTLDAQGDPNAFWVFQATSTVITATDSLIVLLNGASADNVFWQVGSSATLGTDSEFSGTIMAQASITMTTGAELTGRALALDGAVTMDNNLIMVPEPGSALLLGFGAVLGLLRRRKASH
jgi:hypothetical protein